MSMSTRAVRISLSNSKRMWNIGEPYKAKRQKTASKVGEQPLLLQLQETQLNLLKGVVKHFGKMSYEFETMFNNEEFSDFTFTVNGVIYYAHKCVLASRSPVFAAMFRSNMSETQTNNMVIDDFDCNVFEEMLHYLYTGDISSVKQLALELLEIVDKYQIMDLKELCEQSIEINNENSMNILIKAHFYNAENLKTKAINYIVDNLRSIRRAFGNEFQQLCINYPFLMREIFDAIANKQCNQKCGHCGKIPSQPSNFLYK